MPMTQEELLSKLDAAIKALTTSDLGPSKLQPEVADRYIRKAIDTSKMLRECRVLPMRSDTRNIDKIGFASRILQAATEATEPGTTSKPTFEQRTLTVKEVIAAVDVSYSTLEDNIERGQLEQTLLDLIAERASADLEELFLYADPSSSDTFIKLLGHRDWLTMTEADDGVHVEDYEGSEPDKISDVFKTLLNKVPHKYFGNLAQWRFYCAFSAERKYREELAERATAAGDRALLEDVPVFYQGIPVIWVPKIVVETRNIGGSDKPNCTDVLFCHPSNLVVGFRREVDMERERKPRARTVEITVTARCDCNVEEPDAIAIARNVSLGS